MRREGDQGKKNKETDLLREADEGSRGAERERAQERFQFLVAGLLGPIFLSCGSKRHSCNLIKDSFQHKRALGGLLLSIKNLNETTNPHSL